MKLYYAYNENKVTNSVQEDYGQVEYERALANYNNACAKHKAEYDLKVEKGEISDPYIPLPEFKHTHKLDSWKIANPNWILQEDVGRDNSILKQVDGVIMLKDDDDYKQERIDNSEESKKQLLNACTQYQQGSANPRIDSNFFSMLTSTQLLKKVDPTLEIPKCDANIAWSNALWADHETRKTNIDNGDVPNFDFSNNGNPPYTWDECYSELPI